MCKVLRLLGDNIYTIIIVLAVMMMLFIAGQGRAMGVTDRVGEYSEGRQTAVQNTVTAVNTACLSPITTAEGKKICPIMTPGQAIKEALDEQLEEAP